MFRPDIWTPGKPSHVNAAEAQIVYPVLLMSEKNFLLIRTQLSSQYQILSQESDAKHHPFPTSTCARARSFSRDPAENARALFFLTIAATEVSGKMKTVCCCCCCREGKTDKGKDHFLNIFGCHLISWLAKLIYKFS